LLCRPGVAASVPDELTVLGLVLISQDTYRTLTSLKERCGGSGVCSALNSLLWGHGFLGLIFLISPQEKKLSQFYMFIHYFERIWFSVHLLKISLYILKFIVHLLKYAPYGQEIKRT
jgi:hypothetical protein